MASVYQRGLTKWRTTPAQRRRTRTSIERTTPIPETSAGHDHGAGRCGAGRKRAGGGDDDLRGREVRDEGVGTGGIELGEHVVEQEERRRAEPLGHREMSGEPQGEGDATLLALR